MGNAESLFYPDNGKRHDRAEQLGNDCENYKREFESKKTELERILGPYQPKINRVMQAFGCNDLDDLGRLVERTGTKEALAQWNRVKNVYDKTQMVDQVIYGAMGVVAVAGLTISTVGALAGGIGFFAGIAITGNILMALGAIGLIFGAIAGAVNRSKLRDAINSLFESRLKIKRIVAHLDNLFLWMPIIQEIYQFFEEAGFTEEQIIQKLKNKKFNEPIQQNMMDENYHNVARSLRDLDESRGSWVNEDPNWEKLANTLQTMEGINFGVAARSAAPVQARSLPSSAQKHSEVATTAITLPAYAINIYSTPSTNEPPPAYDSVVGVNVKPADDAKAVSPVFSNPIGFHLNEFLDERSASVTMRTPDQNHLVGLGESGTLDLIQTPMQPPWTVVFANADIDKYRTLRPTPETTVEVFMRVPTTNQYLVADGSLTDKESLATRFVLSYSNPHPISTPIFKKSLL
ncbi:hypothetical protein BD779DRAFT_1676940 [Infundibulicybe gibba]|nr:hypothetical protein BD779DRAFT_1676940 [Infundibulicybe gibba]